MRLTAVLLALGIGLVACSSLDGPVPGSNGGTTSSAGAGASGPGASGPSASVPGGVDVQGSLVSTGIYEATWTWETGNAAGPGIGGITLTSDKGTFANIQVLNDGSITFTSGAPELSGNATYDGSKAEVQLKGEVPCGFTLDHDLTGSDDGRVLHIKGSLTILGTSFNC